MMISALGLNEVFSAEEGSAKCCGIVVTDPKSFESYLTSRAAARVRDDDDHESFASELRDLASTGMQTKFVERLLSAVPQEPAWAIGEALAECLLADDEHREVCWPWNLVRDRRTPRASLPGADLVGFCKEGEKIRLLFGEVKTSSDSSTPPAVMSENKGLPWQLEQEATRLDVQHSLLKWLRSRCTSHEHVQLWVSAIQRYVKSRGKDILLVGSLLRDTPQNALDVSERAAQLARKLPSPTRIELFAWYFPVPIADWKKLIYGEPS